jgi:hypothetical protein
MPPGALRDVDLRDIGFDAPGRVHEHIPSQWGVLRRILRSGEVTHEDVFIDIGCGMGPVLVEAAARYDFKRVIGIDVVPEFTKVASETIARGRDRLRCKDVEVVTGDITRYELPDDVTVVYMADPFRAQLFDAAVAKMIESVDRNPRRFRIIYNMPVEGGRLERTGRAHLVRYGRRRNRPWTRAPDLAMYEIEPLRIGASAARPPRGTPGRIRGRLRPLRRRSGKAPDAGEQRESDFDVPVQLGSGGSSVGSGIAFGGSVQDRERLRYDFEQSHAVLLPGFLAEPLLDRIRAYIAEGDFSPRTYGGGRTEAYMEEGKAFGLLAFLTNNARLFEFVRTITRCKAVGAFEGGVCRMMPGPEHADPWHGEIFGHGMVAMSIDVSPQPYSGGALEIRERHSGEMVRSATHTAPGDAVLVRLAPFLQHRITPVEGDGKRTVYAGQFMRYRSDAYSKLALPRSVA